MAGRRRPRLRAVKGTPTTDALAALSDDHLMCRDFGHSWRPWTAEWIPQRRQYVEALGCVRCGTVRRRLLDEWGALLGNAYTYSEGYQIHGVGRLTGDDRNDLRLAGLQAVMRATGETPSNQPINNERATG